MMLSSSIICLTLLSLGNCIQQSSAQLHAVGAAAAHEAPREDEEDNEAFVPMNIASSFGHSLNEEGNDMDPMCVRNGMKRHDFSDGYIDQWYPDSKAASPACRSRQVNARGTYTANLAPCNFTYHSIQEQQDKNLRPHEMSVLCSKENELDEGDAVTKEEYASNWPDECVRDFQRCYSVKRDEKIFYRMFCKKNWKIPEGVTHIGVDCTADHQAKLKAIEERKKQFGPHIPNDDHLNRHFAEQRRQNREMYAVIAGVVILCLLACSSSMCCAYNWVFKPFMAIATATKEKDDQISEMRSLVNKDDGERTSGDLSSSGNVRRRADKVQPIV